MIDAAYKALMKRYHPDAQNPAATTDAQAKAINEAYRILRNPETRARYDRDLTGGRSSARAQAESRAETPPPSAPTAHEPSSGKGPSGLISLAFIGLAVLVIISAIGSFGVGSNSSDATSPNSSASPASDAVADQPPAKPAASAPVAAETKTDGSDTPPTPGAGDGPKPSFACGRADTDILRMVCAVPELATADAAMADAYRQALGKSADPAPLRDEQRRWLQTRDHMPTDQAALLQLYSQRIEQLKTGASTDLPPF